MFPPGSAISHLVSSFPNYTCSAKFLVTWFFPVLWTFSWNPDLRNGTPPVSLMVTDVLHMESFSILLLLPINYSKACVLLFAAMINPISVKSDQIWFLLWSNYILLCIYMKAFPTNFKPYAWLFVKISHWQPCFMLKNLTELCCCFFPTTSFIVTEKVSSGEQNDCHPSTVRGRETQNEGWGHRGNWDWTSGLTAHF